MTFLPIVERELRVAARRRGTYWGRFGVALVGLGIGGLILSIPHLGQPSILGKIMFLWLAILALGYSLLAGVLSAADSLSEEKREGTLGLLFLTDLKGYDVVLGKLAATSLNTLYGMLALIPIMAIPLLAGGVSGAEFWRVVAVCLNNLFFSLAVAMFFSACCRDERLAMGLALGLVVFMAGGLPLLGGIMAQYAPRQQPSPIFFVPSPGYACFMAFDETYRNIPFNYFYISVGCIHGLSWVLLLCACLIVPRTWQDKAERASAARRRHIWFRLSHGSSQAQKAIRQRRLAFNPFYWLTSRDRLKFVAVWVPLAIGAMLWLLGLVFNPDDWKEKGWYVVTGFSAHTILKIWLASEACRRFVVDRKNGAMELLLSTPLSVPSILWGQWLSLLKQFGGPVLGVVVADCVFMMSDPGNSEWVLTCLAGITGFLADMATLSVLGMWLGLRCRGVNRAAISSVVRIMVQPWTLWVGLMIFIVVLLEIGRGSSFGGQWFDDKFRIGSWWFIAMGVDLGWGLYAWMRLQRGFREFATRRTEARRFRWL